jgi:hypothetical protein
MKKTGLEAVTELHRKLAEAGMPRTSQLNGGGMTGWTEAYGSTGFSVRKDKDGDLQWHLVVSGKPLFAYRDYEQRSDDETYEYHEPLETESLFPRLRAVFEDMGLAVKSLRCSGHQLMWDDDVEFSVMTDHPAWLEEYVRAPVDNRPWYATKRQLP